MVLVRIKNVICQHFCCGDRGRLGLKSGLLWIPPTAQKNMLIRRFWLLRHYKLTVCMNVSVNGICLHVAL